VKQTHRLEAMGQARLAAGGSDSGKYKGLTVLTPRGERHFNGQVRCHEEALSIPLKWRAGRRIFVNSMSDLFHEKVPFEFVDRVFAVMALCPQHTFQVLTKRPARMAAYLGRQEVGDRDTYRLVMEAALQLAPGNISDRADFLDELAPRWPLPNVWLGTSVEDQAAADERIPHLLRCPAAVRFLSCEPLLGAVDLAWPLEFDEHHPQEGDLPRGGFLHAKNCQSFCDYSCGGAEYNGARPIDWVIVGGESGSDRVCDVDWIRSIVGQCRAAGVPVFVKQLGSHVVDRGLAPGPLVPAMDAIEGRRPRRITQRDVDARGFCLNDRKGGDMAEWPEDLRVREMPKERDAGRGIDAEYLKSDQRRYEVKA